ncbi:cyclin domain containing protein, putative [Eimeria brunetti]|uniref:Cyclin domain containing protein, putative n=1 Tax=Eimeria brunetti TaxID=51314 RepID=U6LLJ2_9EIME|nr:cyclin domain containing protein, putative [Eimeria brunetti]
MDGRILQTTPVSTAQEKVEAGGHTERETATTAAATPPANQAGGPVTGERISKTEAHSVHSTGVNSGRVELKSVQNSQNFVEQPPTPGFAGEDCQNRERPARNDGDVEENAEEFALLRHSGVSFVCVRALVSFLTNCCAISHFGSDERLQQVNDLSTSPFHCSSRPQIGIEEYLVKRIFRHGKQTINEGVMAVALLSRFLCKQNTLLSAALRENAKQHRQQQRLDNCTKEATVREKDFRPGSEIARSGSPTESFAAIAARIGYIEFNYLTAHRLLLTAAFLARKTHRDDHTSIRHWAQLGGVPVEDLIEAESAFVQVVEWRVQVTLDEFFGVRTVPTATGLAKTHIAIFLARLH